MKKAAAEQGYRPDAMARAMITGKSRMIGPVVAYLDNQFYPEAVESLCNVLQERGYTVLIFMASPTFGDGVQAVVEEILDYQVDGIVLASVHMSSDSTSRHLGIGASAISRGSRKRRPGVTANGGSAKRWRHRGWSLRRDSGATSFIPTPAPQRLRCVRAPTGPTRSSSATDIWPFR